LILQGRTGGTPGGDGALAVLLAVLLAVMLMLLVLLPLLLLDLSTRNPTNKNRSPLVIFCPQCRNLPGKIKACPR
jgi:hypothetical protein